MHELQIVNHYFSTEAEKALNHINAPDSTTLFTISTQVAYKISHDIKHSRKSKSIVSLSAKNIVLAEKEGYDNTRTNIFHNYNSTTIKYQILTKQYFYYFCVLFNIQSSLVSPFLMIVTQFIPLIYCIVSSILVNSMSAIDSLYIHVVLTDLFLSRVRFVLDWYGVSNHYHCI